MPPADAALKYADLKARLSSGQKLAPVIVLAGPEPFFKEEALGLIAGQLERTAEGELNRVGLDGGSTELESILATHLSPSLFGGEKLVVVRAFDKARASDRKSFLKSIAECTFPEGIRLVLLTEETKALAELKGQEVLTVVFYVPWQSDVMRWIEQQLRQRKLACSPGVSGLLYRLHGKAVPWKSDLEVDLFRLAGSIERLERHASGRQSPGGGPPAAAAIDETTVTAVLGRGEPPDVFRIVDLVARRDRPRALAAVRALVESAGESPVGLVALLLDRFEKLLRVRAASREAGPRALDDAVRHARAFESATRSDLKRTASSSLSAALSGAGGRLAAVFAEVKDFQKSSLVLQCERFSEAELVDRFLALVELDRRLKSGAGDEASDIELFVAGV